MIVYAESSAVLSWLLGEDRGETVREVLAAADAVLTSSLTLVECDRSLIRAQVVENLDEAVSTALRRRLEQLASRWTLLTLGSEVVERARRAFPVEPLRSLDALHLASVVTARSAIPDLAVLSLDERIRGNASELGLEVQPTSQ